MLFDLLSSQVNLVVFLSIAAAAVLIALFGTASLTSANTDDPASLQPDADTLVFRFDGTDLHSASDKARAALSGVRAGTNDLERLWASLGGVSGDVRRKTQALLNSGRPFIDIINRQSHHPQEIKGSAVGALVEIRVQPAGEGTYALQRAEEQLALVEAERNLFAEMIDRLPTEIYATDEDGVLTCANQAYRSRFSGEEAGEPQNLRSIDPNLLEVEPGAQGDVPIGGAGDEETVLRIHNYRLNDGAGQFGICQNVSELYRTKQSLDAMMATLVDTFAHLSVGLAVFNEASHLTLFNPALTEMLSLNPAELAKRPALRQFLEVLRAQRKVPEQRDFASWRRQITRLEAGARDGQYLEDWQLPDGQILRVTGKPHAQGGIALLFEDISSSISLERRYRNEIGISQATLDHITDAVAVFNLSGALVFANTAFDDLWGVAAMDEHPGPTILQMTQHWRELCHPTPVLGELCEFVSSADNRAAWQSDLSLRDGRRIQGHFAPLPDGSALVVFTDKTDGSLAGVRPDDTLGLLSADVLNELLSGPVEDAITCLETGADHPERPKGLSGPTVANSLRAGRRQAEGLLAIALGLPASSTDPDVDDPFLLNGLRTFLDARGVALDLTNFQSGISCVGPDMRSQQKLIWSLALAAIEQDPDDKTIVLTRSNGEAEQVYMATLVRSSTNAHPASAGGLALNVLQRLVGQLGGGVQITVGDGARVSIICRVPLNGVQIAEKPPENTHLRIASSNG